MKKFCKTNFERLENKTRPDQNIQINKIMHGL